MNTMIEQLAVEAAESVVSEPCELNMQTEDELGNKIVVPATFIEKFAELIVRECAEEILRWKSEPFPYDPDFGAKLIKQHFGVD